MHDGGRSTLGQRRPQTPREFVDRGQLTGLGTFPLLSPTSHLPFEEAVGSAELGKPRLAVVHGMDGGEDVDQRLGRAPGIVGAERCEGGSVPVDDAVDEFHDVERRVVHREVLAHREGAGHRDGGGRQRAHDPVLPGHVVRGRQDVTERGPADDPRRRAIGHRVGEIRPTAGDQRGRQGHVVRAGDVRDEERSQTTEIDAVRGISHLRGSIEPGRLAITRSSARRWMRSGDLRSARGDGDAVALGVARHAADRHVDAETRGRPVLFGLAAPEAVLTVLAGPVTT